MEVLFMFTVFLSVMFEYEEYRKVRNKDKLNYRDNEIVII